MTKSEAMREAALFEFYARVAWPLHRIFVKHYLSHRCVKCGISEKASPLDEKGVCEICNTKVATSAYVIPEEKQKRMETELKNLLESYSGKGKGQYDALVAVSGGKDSTLLLSMLKTLYPRLRILAFTVDDSFMSDVALRNIDQVVKKLSIANKIVHPNPDIFRKAFAYALTHLGGKGCAETVDTLDGEFFTDVAKDFAAKSQIPLLIMGFSFEQVIRYLKWDWFENRDHEHIKRTTAGLYDIEDITDREYMDIWWDPAKYPSEDIPRVISPFYVWRMGEEEIKKKVTDLGLLSGKEINPLVTNNILIPLTGLVDMAHLGYSSWEPEFARMVREGKADKKNWQSVFELLEYAAKSGTFISKSVDEVLGTMHLTRADVGLRAKNSQDTT